MKELTKKKTHNRIDNPTSDKYTPLGKAVLLATSTNDTLLPVILDTFIKDTLTGKEVMLATYINNILLHMTVMLTMLATFINNRLLHVMLDASINNRLLHMMLDISIKDGISISQAFNLLYNDIIDITSSLQNKFIMVNLLHISGKFITLYMLVIPYSKAVSRIERQKELVKLLLKAGKKLSENSEKRNRNFCERKGSNSKDELQTQHLVNNNNAMIKLFRQELKSNNVAIENSSCTENTEIDDNEVESDSGYTALHKRTKRKIKPSQRFDSHRIQFRVAEREKRRKSVDQWLLLELESDDAIEAGDSDHVANMNSSLNRKRKPYSKDSKDRRSAHETSHIDRLSDSTINSTPFLLVRRYNVADYREININNCKEDNCYYWGEP